MKNKWNKLAPVLTNLALLLVLALGMFGRDASSLVGAAEWPGIGGFITPNGFDGGGSGT
ncbi:MAG: hypothetical protein SXV54_12875 [Chloroflexota bacterium]|nr:hypothetical protein [Chloroflexota bacterium]